MNGFSFIKNKIMIFAMLLSFVVCGFLFPHSVFAGVISSSDYDSVSAYATFTQCYNLLEDYPYPERTVTQKIPSISALGDNLSLVACHNASSDSCIFFFVSKESVSFSYDEYVCDHLEGSNITYASVPRTVSVSNTYSNDNGGICYVQIGPILYGSSGSISYTGVDYLFSDSWSSWGDVEETFLSSICNVLNGVDDSHISEIEEGCVPDSATFDADLGHLKDIKYQYLMERIPTGHKVYYRFSWNAKTSTGINLKKDGYDVAYYWECYGDSVSLLGNAEHYGSLYSDKFLMKKKQPNVYQLLEYAFEGDLYDILEPICDQQPLVCRSFDVVTKLHVAPVYYDGEETHIGSWSHITFDNTMNHDTVTDVVEDELDGDGLEKEYEVSTDNPDGSTTDESGSSTIGIGDTVEEAIDNSDEGDSTSLDVDTYKDVSNTLSVFVNSIKSFNTLVVSVLSWLPPWVLAFLVASIVIVGIMIIKRAIF